MPRIPAFRFHLPSGRNTFVPAFWSDAVSHSARCPEMRFLPVPASQKVPCWQARAADGKDTAQAETDFQKDTFR